MIPARPTLTDLNRLYAMKQAQTAIQSSSPEKENTSSSPPDDHLINGSVAQVWHKSAPRTVRRAFSDGEHQRGWKAWKKYLSAREPLPDPEGLLPPNVGPLSWALPDGLDPPPHAAWLDRALRLLRESRGADPSIPRDLLCWLAESAGAAARPAYALEALAAARTIVRLGSVLSPEVWWAHLLAAVADAQAIEPEDDPLVHQLLAGETALTLAFQLPEITACRKLKSKGRGALSSGLADLLDGEGLPHARHLGLLRPLLASWTRCRAMGEQLKGGCWTKAAQYQYEWLIRAALRLTRHDGTHVFSQGSAGTWKAELFAAAMHFGGDQDDLDIANLVLPPAKKAATRHAAESALPKPASHSQWAAAAVLRPKWSRSAERLTVLYHQQRLQMELGCAKDLLLSGTWELQLRCDGRTATPRSDWEQLCWVSDDVVDFLELEIQFSDGLRVQRQMLLARQDRLLLLADAVLGTRQTKLQYLGRLPLCPKISFDPAEPFREGLLAGSKPRALVLPLALPERTSHARDGRLVRTDNGLELQQSSRAGSLYAPLLFDLDRRRIARPTTWRQLTVAESLVIRPAEVAVAYRAALGKQQWLIYRSLAERANRTVLGHNLSSEMLLARFHRSGEVEPLLEIE